MKPLIDPLIQWETTTLDSRAAALQAELYIDVYRHDAERTIERIEFLKREKVHEILQANKCISHLRWQYQRQPDEGDRAQPEAAE
jgi:hypothetical protein